MSNDFEEALDEALNSKTLTEVETSGRLIVDSSFVNNDCDIIAIKVYELERRLYLIKYINDEYVVFLDIS